MLKAKDAADVVLMNNFLADFPVEEVKYSILYQNFIQNMPIKCTHCHIFSGQVRLEVTWRDVGIRLRPLNVRLQYKVFCPKNLFFIFIEIRLSQRALFSRSWMMRIWWR